MICCLSGIHVENSVLFYPGIITYLLEGMESLLLASLSFC